MPSLQNGATFVVGLSSGFARGYFHLLSAGAGEWARLDSRSPALAAEGVARMGHPRDCGGLGVVLSQVSSCEGPWGARL